MATSPDSLIAQLLSPQGVNGFQQSYQAAQNNRLGQQEAQQQLQQGAIKIGQEQQAQQQQVNYAKDINDWIQRGAPSDGFLSLAAKYPQQAKGLVDASKYADEAQRNSDLSYNSSVYNAANNGRTDLVTKLLTDRQKALRNSGQPTDTIDDALQQLTADPKGGLNNVKGIALSKIYANDPDGFAKANGIGGDKTHVISTGGSLVSDAGVELYHNNDAAPKYQTVKNADGSESVLLLGGGGQASGAGGGSNGSGAPLSVRLNNPGAIRDNPANKWQGQVGSENGFAQFDTPENGARAHRILIGNQIKAGYDTPLSWAQHYAPASDGNDPAAYAATVAKGLGIGVNDKIPLSAVPKVAQLSAQVESGGTPAPNLPQANGGTATDFSKVSPGQAAKVIFTSQGAGGGAGGLDQDAVDFAANWAIAHGGKAPPGFARNKGAQVAIQNAIAQKAKDAGLTTDQVIEKGQNFVTAQQTLNAFAKGAQGNTVRSLNVAVTHLAQLHDAVLALQNGNVPAFNHWSQLWQKATGGPLPGNAEAIKGIVADEVNKAVIGGAGALADREGLANNLKISGSPDQLLGAINQYTKAMSGQLGGLKRQYEGGTGRKDFDRYVSPVAQRVLENEGAQVNPPAGGKQVGFYQGKPVYQLPNGKRVVAQ